jgi:hypothetical protein
MRTQCKTCGKNCEGEYCFQHKPRKKLQASVKKQEEVQKTTEMQEFFLQIWKKKPHKSEVSGESLGSEALSIFFHHVLPKEKYSQARFDEENIILLTWEEHDQVERDITRYEEVNKRREQLKKKYDI